jgi:sugar phosphate isomerase/epimerase
MDFAYCTNVHPAEDLPGVLAQLDRYAVPVRERLGIDELPLGLWLSATVAAGLAADPDGRRRLRRELAVRGLSVSTLNAFPYGGFHNEVVKRAVYLPAWTDRRRLRYTLDCAVTLASLLPEHASYGSISTLPLGWRAPWAAGQDDQATAALNELSRQLRTLNHRNQCPVKLAVEPEPGCVLDTVCDAVNWLAGRVDPEYIGICLDTCHLAVSFADPAREVARIEAAGLEILKVQASAALHLEQPADQRARQALAEFAEPRYLHQVRELTANASVLAADDLPEAMATLPGRGPWRVHFHVPLHARPEPPLSSTTGTLRAAMAAVDELSAGRARPHVEVETYTWAVLPGPLGDQRAPRGDLELVAGITAELQWAQANLAPQVLERVG